MKYLKCWWRPNSIVNPSNTVGTYYGVKYDLLGRYIEVEEFNAPGQLAGRTRFEWRLDRLAKSYTYSPVGELQYFQVYKYGWLGNLLGVEKRFPDGTLVHLESSDL